MRNPFADLIGLAFEHARAGESRCALEIDEQHLNPNHVLHGAVMYALADTGMGAAVHHTLEPDQLCATIQITMNYFKPVTGGRLVCDTTMVNRGKTIAHLESRLSVGATLVATAVGNYAIFTPRAARPDGTSPRIAAPPGT